MTIDETQYDAKVMDMLDETEMCECGHVDDEHYSTRSGYGACSVKKCDCLQFDRREDDNAKR